MANNKFSVTNRFPNGFDFTELWIRYDNGKREINIKLPMVKNECILVTCEYYSIYAAVILNHSKSKNYNYRNSLKDDFAQVSR